MVGGWKKKMKKKGETIKKRKTKSTDTYAEWKEEIDIVGKLFLAGVEVKKPGQKHFLHQFMQMMHVQKQLPCDVTLQSQLFRTRFLFP